MAGLINSEDIAAVKARSSIEDVVREHVTLRSAGPGSLKGLCPFHDEKTPSFNIRPAVGAWHCFGCGEGGDVISFIQKVDHLSFSEAVERLAQKLGMELRYEDGGATARGGARAAQPPHRGAPGRRGVLHRRCSSAARPPAPPATSSAPATSTASTSSSSASASPRAAERTSCGTCAPRASPTTSSSPAGSPAAARAGSTTASAGRLVWPIRDITGDTVGFGARRIFDDDRIEAKYLNTSETPIYKKSTVLYGLDLAKKKISQGRQAVVVEGYTDVMACHLAGVETAVATCGTAFGADHIKTLRRLMRDEAGLAPAKVIFTFDGDAAGQKAAMRAFADDEKWTSQSFVAVEKSGKDPCELRQAGGDPAVQALIEDAVPMFEFAVRTTIKRFDVATRRAASRPSAPWRPIIASIRDQSLRPEYTREVSGMLGLDVEQVATEVSRAGKIKVEEDARADRTGRAERPRRP